MKSFTFLFLLISFLPNAQIADWKGILVGDFDALKKQNIKTLMVRKDGKVIKTLNVFPENNALIVKDSLGSENYLYNNSNQIISIHSNKYHGEKKIEIDYENNFVKTISIETKNSDNTFLQKFSFPDLKNKKYKEFEFFTYKDSKNDTIYYHGKRYFFNKVTPELSYFGIYKKGEYLRKFFFNKTYVLKNFHKNGYTIDSTFLENNKEVNYRFENFGNQQNYIIKKDSVFTINKVLGKKNYEKTEFNNVIFREIKYNENGKVDFIKNYIYHKNSNNKDVLWEIRTLDENKKLTKKEFPNKKYYKLKKGVLVNRKNFKNSEIRVSCGLSYNKKALNYTYNFILSFSPSIMSSEITKKNINDNFDTYVVELEDKEDIIFNVVALKDNEIRLQYKSDIYILDNELIRNMKSTFLWRNKIEKLVKGITIEAETFKGKKYQLDLQKNLELFSIQTFIFITTQDY